MSRAQDEDYDRLLSQHGASLRRCAASYEADLSRREDLFQEICLAIWRALPGFRGDCSERTFVFRIAHNRGLSHSWKRRNVRTRELEQDTAEDSPILVDARQNPEADAVAEQRRRRLRAAIRALPLAQRQVLTLSLEGLTYREIAAVLGLSESNVGVRLNRARSVLRQKLQSRISP